MMVDTSHVFNVSKGNKTYQVIDNDEDKVTSTHRYTVLVWDRKGLGNGGKLVASDGSIYATSKIEAVNKYIDKIKMEKILNK